MMFLMSLLWETASLMYSGHLDGEGVAEEEINQNGNE
jgi:hypothetical protein